MRNAGPYFFMLRLAGNRSSVSTPRTLAKMYSSPSGTRRCPVSNFASDSLLMSQPKSWSFADRLCCVQPLRSRILRTCRPIKFNGGEARFMRGTVTRAALEKCSLQVTKNKRACIIPGRCSNRLRGTWTRISVEEFGLWAFNHYTLAQVKPL